MTTKSLQKRAEAPPTDRLLRVTPFSVRAADASADAPNDGLTLDGYAAVFNRETLIDSWEGRFWESAAPGSMKKTFREQVPRVQFDHGHHPMIGSIPIASVRSIAEEVDPVLAPDGGAHLVARVFDNWLTQPVRDAIAEGAINGMSFRFSVVREEWRDPDGKVIRDEQDLAERLFESWARDLPEDELLHRTLREVRVPELGPVVWPAYEETSVGMRSVTIDLAAARAGDRTERRKLAEALYQADATLDPDADPDEDKSTNSEPEVQGIVRRAATPAPGTTADKAAGTHAKREQQKDAPGGTSKAANHPSPPRRRNIDMALDSMRRRLMELPDEDPTRKYS